MHWKQVPVLAGEVVSREIAAALRRRAPETSR